MGRVIVGVDPHKKSVSIAAIDEQGMDFATGRFGTRTRDYKAMLGYIRPQWPDHRWAIEGAHGVGRPLAQRLLATVKPRSLVGKTTRRMAVQEVADLVAADAKLKTLTKELVSRLVRLV